MNHHERGYSAEHYAAGIILAIIGLAVWYMTGDLALLHSIPE